jgi:hypothetical protein
VAPWLNRVPDRAAAIVQGFAQPPAPLQVAEHGFSNYANRIRAFRPLQALLAGRQVLQQIAHPQQIGFSLAHLFRALNGSHCRERDSLVQSSCQRISAFGDMDEATHDARVKARDRLTREPGGL